MNFEQKINENYISSKSGDFAKQKYEKSKNAYKNGNLIKGRKEVVTQDIIEIERIINKTGKFLIEKDPTSLKLFGYR